MRKSVKILLACLLAFAFLQPSAAKKDPEKEWAHTCLHSSTTLRIVCIWL